MLARRLLVMMLLLTVALFASGCGGGQSADEGLAPVEDAPPAVPDPVVEEPDDTGALDSQDVGDLNDVFFAFDKHNLSSESKGTLEANADQLSASGSAQIIIEGHCDERGTKSYNLALGEKRANAARDYLVALGVASSRITVVSYGKERPFDSGHDEAGWAKNRRAHFVVK